MNLTIDVGNTRIKLGVFDAKNVLQAVGRFDASQIMEMQAFCADFKIQKAIVCASGEIPIVLDAFLNGLYEVIYFTHETIMPILNKYATPKTLGKDRLAAVIGAATLFPNKNCLVVIAGTALTFNVLQNNCFLGGTISAGLQMRFNALHHFTAHLPQLHVLDKLLLSLVADNTAQAIFSGVNIGFISEVESMLMRHVNELGNLKIIFSGGDGAFLSKNIVGFKSELEPNIVLIGLNAVLNFL